MNPRTALVLGIALAAIGLAPASAGTRQSYPVQLYTSAAEGVLGSARNSADTVQLLECEVHAYATSRYGYCWARNASGQTKNCYAYDANMIDNIQALATDDHVYFAFNPVNSVCTRVSVVKSSRWEPKSL